VIPAPCGAPVGPLDELCGKTLVVWSIEAARAASAIDRVVVATDEPEVASLAAAAGASVVPGHDRAGNDQRSEETGLVRLLDHLEQHEDVRPEVLVLLRYSAPLTSPEDIDGTVGTLVAEAADSALSVTEFAGFLWQAGSDGAAGFNHDEAARFAERPRHASLLETGAVYAMRAAGFRAAKRRFFGKTTTYRVAASRCLSVDTPADLEVAEVLLRRLQRQRLGQLLPNPVAAVVFDFDGVFTDNRVLVSETGEEAVWCSRGDGWGVVALRRLGIPALVLSAEVNPVVQARCRKLDIPCIQGERDKWPVLQQWLESQGIARESVVFVGNDENDVECLERVGCGVAVGDAQPSARRVARMVLNAKGGAGAVRELCELCELVASEAAKQSG
jgi:N-acylneuraminate cytidylyltransferase